MRTATQAALFLTWILIPSISSAQKDWPSHGGDPGGTKYSNLSQINQDNVSKLEVLWTWETGDEPIPAARVAFRDGAVTPGKFQGSGVVVGGTIPYTPEALEQRNKNRDNWLEGDPEVKCYLPGVPRATYMPQPFQIFQNEHSTFIAYQYAGAVRDIYMEDPGEAQVDSWMGQSHGQWEGDTFVVRVNGFNGQAWLDRAGNFAGYGTVVTERYTMLGPDHIMYEAEIENPETFTEPWTISMPLYRRQEPNSELLEYQCSSYLLEHEWDNPESTLFEGH